MREFAEFVIDETFGVPGVGTVVAGTLKRGVISLNSGLLLGPDIADGTFKPAAVKSIHYKRLPVQQVTPRSSLYHALLLTGSWFSFLLVRQLMAAASLAPAEVCWV